MPWIIITTDDLNDARVADLVTALREEALGVGQTDPAPRIIQTVVDEVRRCIAFCPNTPLDADAAKVPAGLKDMVVQKIVRTMKKRLLMALTDDESSDESLYQKRLEKLTVCEWPVDKPDTPIAIAPVVNPASTPAITPKDRQATRASMDGF
ncbi:MAG: hypothetical protein KF715_08610 [Candidatus Didemnitutus sp.]|nr:hypothetical protein [Candidatus Didemnitutus sp.]